MAASDRIQFVLDGNLVELAGVDPTRTVLQYLREDLRRTGTKEGCAEGDCGACTVVVAEHKNGNTELRAINSCIQFLRTLHGKELLTVESLGRGGVKLHPVQQAMVDNHGSQCGFCTPGFVMSLYALYETNPAPTRREIDDALAGNLCRCTGYRPIVAAATAMYEAPHAEGLLHPEVLAKTHDEDIAIEHGGRRFFAPVSGTALAKLCAQYPDATLLAGGTDIGLWVTKQHRVLDTVIYTGRVSELQVLGTGDTHIEIGAAVPLTDAVPVIVDAYPQLEEMFLRFASPPIRNAGTLGGNVANGSPIGDSMPALMVAGTTLVLRSSNGRRELALDDFYHDYMENELQPGEFLECIRVPLPDDGVILASHKLSKRFDQDISAVCTAYRLELDGGAARDFRMACGGMAATIRRARHCEQAMTGQPWNETTLAAGRAALARDFTPISDMRATADYRLRATQNLLTRFYLETTGAVEETVYAYGRQG